MVVGDELHEMHVSARGAAWQMDCLEGGHSAIHADYPHWGYVGRCPACTAVF